MLREPWGFMRECYRTLGTSYRVSVKGSKAVVLTGPKVRDLYSEAGDNFLDRSFFYQRLEIELDARELIFRTKGERHREIRRCASLAFSRQVATEHLPAAAREMARSFGELVPGQSYDMNALASNVLLAAAGPMLGNSDLRPLISEAGHYASTMMEVAARTRTPMALWRPRYRNAKSAAMKFGYDLLAKWRRGEIENNATHIIGCFDEARDSEGKPLPDADIVSLALLTFVGVGVYINRVVAFMLYELFRNDDLRQRVMDEVDAGFADGATYEALRDMRLLHAVYNETLRLYPIWFLIPFRAEQSFEFDGRQVLAGDLLLISSVQEHFLPEYYVEPERFDPERCLPPRNEHMRRGAFTPFGTGGRRCIATGQTEIMSLLYVAMLLHRTRFRPDPAYQLQIRLAPLPAPHNFALRFEGRREPPSATTLTGKGPSRAEKLSAVADRLAWEELETFKAVVDREMEVCVITPGTEVFQEGDVADAFYLIESGEVDVFQSTGPGTEKKLATLGHGDVFGELGLLRRKPRAASIRVSPGADLLVALRCSADAFDRLLGDLNITGEELIALIRRRKVTASLGRLIPSLDKEKARELVPDATFRSGRAGEIFVREGDPADALHIIGRGSFEVVVEVGAGLQRQVASLGEGEVFGEMGLLRNAPRSATVRVAADCEHAETLVIGKEAFLKLIEIGPTFRANIFQLLGERIQANNRGPAAPEHDSKETI